MVEPYARIPSAKKIRPRYPKAIYGFVHKSISMKNSRGPISTGICYIEQVLE